MRFLEDCVEFLNEKSYRKEAIHGHTDKVGNSENNLTLSRDRAKAVNDYLILSGIDNNRLTYKGFGKTKPITDNNTEQGRSLNRRTEFVIVSM